MGTSVGVANWLLERLAFNMCRKLEDKGLVQRFCTTGQQLEHHSVTNIWSVAVPYIALYYASFRLLWPRLMKGVTLDLNPVHIWAFIWYGFQGLMFTLNPKFKPITLNPNPSKMLVQLTAVA